MGKQVNMVGLRSFSSTVWGNVDEGTKFSVDEGYVSQLEEQKLARRAAPLPKAAPKKDESPKANDGELRQDGPTVAEFVEAGYLAKNYPPTGYASKSTKEEIAAAIDAQEKAEAIKALQTPAPAPQNGGKGKGK